MCSICGTEYPPNVYPRPNAAAGRGDAIFDVGGERVVYEDRRPQVPKPHYVHIIHEENVDGKWVETGHDRFIADTDAVRYADSRGQQVKREGNVTRMVWPQDGGKRRRWRVSYTDDVDSVRNLNRQSGKRVTNRRQIRKIIEESRNMDTWDQEHSGDPWTAVQEGVSADGRRFIVHYIARNGDEPEDDEWYFKHADWLEYID